MCRETAKFRDLTCPPLKHAQGFSKDIQILCTCSDLRHFYTQQIQRDKSLGVIVLQDFIRMLDGMSEINEENSIGFKSLKGTVYFKVSTKVDFENWWKELSTFVPSPMKRTYSSKWSQFQFS